MQLMKGKDEKEEKKEEREEGLGGEITEKNTKEHRGTHRNKNG